MEKVLVTGGSGYIAQHCIAELLKKGYSVRTSLRSENREAEVRQAIAKEVDAFFYHFNLTYKIKNMLPFFVEFSNPATIHSYTQKTYNRQNNKITNSFDRRKNISML